MDPANNTEEVDTGQLTSENLQLRVILKFQVFKFFGLLLKTNVTIICLCSTQTFVRFGVAVQKLNHRVCVVHRKAKEFKNLKF